MGYQGDHLAANTNHVPNTELPSKKTEIMEGQTKANLSVQNRTFLKQALTSLWNASFGVAPYGLGEEVISNSR